MNLPKNIHQFEPSAYAEAVDLLRELAELQPWNYEEIRDSNPLIASRIRHVAALPRQTREERRIWADSWKALFKDMRGPEAAKVAQIRTRGAS